MAKKKGWLDKQFKRVQEEINNSPPWMYNTYDSVLRRIQPMTLERAITIMTVLSERDEGHHEYLDKEKIQAFEFAKKALAREKIRQRIMDIKKLGDRDE